MSKLTFTAAALSAAFLASTPLQAADMSYSQAPGQVQMVSGGIGDGEIEAINQTQNNYSVKLVFAEKTGEYLSNVNMQILDRNNQMLVNSTEAGPIVLLNLKPGTYTLVSGIDGETKSQRISVGNRGLSTHIIHLNPNESQSSRLTSHKG